MNRIRFWHSVLIAYLIILITIIVGAYTGIIPTEIGYIPYYDTIGHLVLLGILSYLLHRALNRKHFRLGGLRIPLAPVLVTMLALAEETIQLASPIRAFSLSDALANIVGIWLFYFLDRWIIFVQRTKH